MHRNQEWLSAPNAFEPSPQTSQQFLLTQTPVHQLPEGINPVVGNVVVTELIRELVPPPPPEIAPHHNALSYLSDIYIVNQTDGCEASELYHRRPTNEDDVIEKLKKNSTTSKQMEKILDDYMIYFIETGKCRTWRKAYEVVVDCMERYAVDPAVQAKGLSCLHQILKECNEPDFSWKCVSHVIKTMKRFRTQSNVQRLGVELLQVEGILEGYRDDLIEKLKNHQSTSEEMEKNLDNLIDIFFMQIVKCRSWKKAFEVLLDCMKRHEADRGIQEKCLICVRQILEESERPAGSWICVSLVLKTMKHFSWSSNIQSLGLQLLQVDSILEEHKDDLIRKLKIHQATCTEIEENLESIMYIYFLKTVKCGSWKKSFEVVVECMERHRENPRLQHKCLTCISQLLKECQEYCSWKKAFEVLLACMERYERDQAIQEKCLACLNHFIEEWKKPFFSRKYVNHVIKIMKQFRKSTNIQRLGVKFLQVENILEAGSWNKLDIACLVLTALCNLPDVDDLILFASERVSLLTLEDKLKLREFEKFILMLLEFPVKQHCLVASGWCALHILLLLAECRGQWNAFHKVDGKEKLCHLASRLEYRDKCEAVLHIVAPGWREDNGIGPHPQPARRASVSFSYTAQQICTGFQASQNPHPCLPDHQVLSMPTAQRQSAHQDHGKHVKHNPVNAFVQPFPSKSSGFQPVLTQQCNKTRLTMLHDDNQPVDTQLTHHSRTPPSQLEPDDGDDFELRFSDDEEGLAPELTMALSSPSGKKQFSPLTVSCSPSYSPSFGPLLSPLLSVQTTPTPGDIGKSILEQTCDSNEVHTSQQFGTPVLKDQSIFSPSPFLEPPNAHTSLENSQQMKSITEAGTLNTFVEVTKPTISNVTRTCDSCDGEKTEIGEEVKVTLKNELVNGILRGHPAFPENSTLEKCNLSNDIMKSDKISSLNCEEEPNFTNDSVLIHPTNRQRKMFPQKTEDCVQPLPKITQSGCGPIDSKKQEFCVQEAALPFGQTNFNLKNNGSEGIAALKLEEKLWMVTGKKILTSLPPDGELKSEFVSPNVLKNAPEDNIILLGPLLKDALASSELECEAEQKLKPVTPPVENHTAFNLKELSVKRMSPESCDRIFKKKTRVSVSDQCRSNEPKDVQLHSPMTEPSLELGHNLFQRTDQIATALGLSNQDNASAVTKWNMEDCVRCESDIEEDFVIVDEVEGSSDEEMCGNDDLLSRSKYLANNVLQGETQKDCLKTKYTSLSRGILLVETEANSIADTDSSRPSGVEQYSVKSERKKLCWVCENPAVKMWLKDSYHCLSRGKELVILMNNSVLCNVHQLII